MTDRELLELAAKAAGIGPVIGFAAEAGELMIGPRNHIRYWNPLGDDGAALRLAVKLDIDINFWGRSVVCGTDDVEAVEVVGSDEMSAATRRAIVRAAAEIGRAMP